LTFSPFGLLPSCFLPFSLDPLPLLYACTLFFLSFDVRNKLLQRGQFHVSASCPISLPSPIDSWPLLCACALLTFAKFLQFLANWAPASDMLVAFTLALCCWPLPNLSIFPVPFLFSRLFGGCSLPPAFEWFSMLSKDLVH